MYGAVFVCVLRDVFVFALCVLFGGMSSLAVMFVCLCFCLVVILFGCIFVWLYCCFGLVVMLSGCNLIGRECDWSGFCGWVGVWLLWEYGLGMGQLFLW